MVGEEPLWPHFHSRIAQKAPKRLCWREGGEQGFLSTWKVLTRLNLKATPPGGSCLDTPRHPTPPGGKGQSRPKASEGLKRPFWVNFGGSAQLHPLPPQLAKFSLITAGVVLS